jgi:hypothetical protein
MLSGLLSGVEDFMAVRPEESSSSIKDWEVEVFIAPHRAGQVHFQS